MGEHFGRRTLGNEAHRTGLNAGDDGAGLFDPGYHDYCQIRRDSAQFLDRIQTEFGLKAQIEQAKLQIGVLFGDQQGFADRRGLEDGRVVSNRAEQQPDTGAKQCVIVNQQSIHRISNGRDRL